MAGAATAALVVAWTAIVAPWAPWLAALGLLLLGLYEVRLYPRKTIEIGWWDLLAALRFALFPKDSMRAVLEASLARQWSSRGDAFACLSARTAMDLVLTKLALPEGSEVLFAPGISIPAIMDIVRSHGLRPVGVEPPSGADLLVSDLKGHVTAETRVLVITHVFGAIFDAAPLIREAHALGLFVVEDCAQAFLGTVGPGGAGGEWENGFRGHEESDVTFVSFGLMKTSTCLGGGMCCVRDAKLREAVLKLQASWGIRPLSQFRKIVLKACGLKLISGPYMWGLAASLVSALGIDFDEFIVRSVRGFPNSASFRLRPSTPLLQLMDRRLRSQGGSTYTDAGSGRSLVAKRRTLAASVSEALAEGGMSLVSSGCPSHSCWLLPLVDDDPGYLAQGLRERGYDATSSSTQLCSVEKVTKSGTPTAAQGVIGRIVYLPLDTEMPRRAVRGLGDAIIDLRQRRCDAPSGAGKGKRQGCSRSRASLSMLLLAAVMLLRPAVLLPWLPSIRLLANVHLCGSVAAVTILIVARFLAAERQLRVDRELLQALPGKSRPEGLTYWATRPAIEGRVDGAVLLTGCTGFVGGGILFALLARAEEMGITRVALLIRKKAGAGAKARLAELRSSPGFEEVAEAFDRLVEPLEGDAAMMDFGWEDPQRPWPFQEPLRVVLHCAGDVRFDQPLQQAAVSLVSGTLQVMQLAARWGAQRFVAVSTAFVHAVPSSSASSADFLAERLVELRDFDPMELYRDAVNHGGWAEKVMRDLGFPNTYTFAKAIAEHLVIRACAANGLDARIVRPSIVGPAWAAPYAGWCGERPSTIVAGAALLSGRAVRIFRCSEHPCPLVPVDMVAEVALKAMAGSGGVVGGRILQAAVDASEAVRVPSFHELMGRLFQVLALVGEFSLPEAGLLCRLQRWAHGRKSFWLLHAVANLLPAALFALAATAAAALERVTGLGGRDAGRRAATARALARYAALPVQYLPFTCPTSPWLFRSSLRLPDNWDAVEYTVLIHQAAIGFARSAGAGGADRRVAPGRNSRRIFQELRVVSRKPVWHDALVTFSMPGSPIFVSAAAFIVRRVFQWMDLNITVDAASLVSVTNLHAPLVLCPTHRSLLDFVIIGLSCFQLRPMLPMLQVPHVAADAEFSGLPVMGRVLVALGAFFVRRGGGTVQPDPTLRAEVGRVFREGRPLEVFLEGLRSRGRRQMRLRTGLLRALRDVAQRTVALVPMVLSYELLPEDQTFYDELRGLPRPPLSVLALLRWALRGVRGELPSFGDVHVRLGSPQVLDSATNLQELLSGVQEQLVNLTSLTELHARALAELLELPPREVAAALRTAGLPLRASRIGAGRVLLDSQRWPLALQVAVILRKRLPKRWAAWVVEPVVERRRLGSAEDPEDAEVDFHRSTSMESDANAVGAASKAPDAEKPQALDLDAVVAALRRRFEAATDAARETAAALRESGVLQITEEHLLQQLLQDDCGPPPPLARGAAAIIVGRQGSAGVGVAEAKEPAAVSPLWPSAQKAAKRQRDNEEALDRWGFKDTKFVAQWVNGQPAVQITSSRYGSIASRPSHKLWSFFRSELRVPMSVRDTLPKRPLPEVPPPASGLVERLAAAVPAARVRADAEARLRAGTGHGLADIWRLRSREVPRMPDAVVRPESEEEVLAILQAANADDGEVGPFAVVPVGGRTNVTSATACPSHEEDSRPFVSLDMRGLNRLLWVSSEDGSAHLEAGITGSALKEVLAGKGVTMGMEPDSMELSTLGGWIATRASGMKRARYGNIEDLLLEVRVATPQGMLWQRHGGGSGFTSQTALGRSSTNLELTGLTLGSEGCLGVVTSAVVRVRPLPEAVEYQSVVFPGWAAGAAFMREVARLPAALRPASCRLMDNKQLKLSQALREDPSQGLRAQLRNGVKLAYLRTQGVNLEEAAATTLLFEGSRAEVAMQKRALGPLVSRTGGIWGGSSSGEAGYALTFAIAYLRDFGLDYRILSESLETLAPWSVVKSVWPAVRAAVEEEHRAMRVPGRPFLSCRMTQLYDEGAVLYMYMAVSTAGLSPSRALEVFQRLEHAARAAVLSAGGCLSHHHGVGKLRAPLLSSGQSPALATALRGLKGALDPHGVLGARNGAWASTGDADAEDVSSGAQGHLAQVQRPEAP